MRVKLAVELVVDDIADVRKALETLASGLGQMDMTELQDWTAAGPIKLSVPVPQDPEKRMHRKVGSFELERVL